MAEQLYRRINFAHARHAARLLEVYQTVVAQARSYNPELAQTLLDNLHRDGVDTTGPSFVLSQRGRSGLQPLSEVATTLTAEQLHTQIARINASIESDPALAIGTTKELVETTCKTILADLGEKCATLDFGDLVKAGLGEMRNYYGFGHGQDGRARGLTPRHVRLAVGAAAALAMFLFDPHRPASLGGRQ